MFDRRLPAVVPMDHRYLAKEDGSEMSKGRGMGQEKRPRADMETDRRGGRDRNAGPKKIEKTPYMHMTFHPLERRLDTSIFRALFASSTRQARQFVVHGFVKVNGKKMIYPGYQLNPGDMFSVDPDRVLFGTGARKLKKTSNRSILDVQRAYAKRQERDEGKAAKKATGKSARDESAEAEDLESGMDALTVESHAEEVTADEQRSKYSKDLKALVKRAKAILGDAKRDLSGKRKEELRSFSRQVKAVFNTLKKTDAAETEATLEGFETALAEILTKVPSDSIPQSEKPAVETAEGASSNPQMQDAAKTDAYRARKDAELLHAALERARANPVDVDKPYATPWEPREFMSAFAFIPRYLEVNQNICSAVYLRHPVARPGLAEVPTPFSAETMALGFNWYLRRR
jgi:ribosomal protein S4